jgi:hypothetical protein
MRTTSVTARIVAVRLLRIFVVLLCASTLAVAAAGCGGKSKTYAGTKPDAWAAGVCGALSVWAQGLQIGSTSLQNDLKSAKDIKAVKARFIVFLKDAETSSGAMLAKVRATGAPAVKDGPALQSELETGLQRAQASFSRAIATAEKLSTSDPQAFSTGVQKLGATVQSELTAVGQDFNKLGDKYNEKSLNEATAKQAACSKLGT